jgi:hypothetical protein
MLSEAFRKLKRRSESIAKKKRGSIEAPSKSIGKPLNFGGANNCRFRRRRYFPDETPPPVPPRFATTGAKRAGLDPIFNLVFFITFFRTMEEEDEAWTKR